MASKSLGLAKNKPLIATFKRLQVKGYEEEFLNYWKSLGFRKELDKNSKSYANSIKALRSILKGSDPWGSMSMSELKNYCLIFKTYTDQNAAHRVEGQIITDPKKLYFHQFVMTYSGYSYLLAVVNGKIRAPFLTPELKDFSEDVAKLLGKIMGRCEFSFGEIQRIQKFAKVIDIFYEDNKNRIAFGVDKLTIVRGSFSVITDFRKLKSISANILIYTGNYAAGAALEQAMEQFGYWKIYSKYEAPDASVKKDPEKTKKVMEKITKKEEDDLPEIVKRRREEMKKNGIEIKTKKEQEEDCSRRDEFLRKKKTRRNPFSK